MPLIVTVLLGVFGSGGTAPGPVFTQSRSSHDVVYWNEPLTLEDPGEDEPAEAVEPAEPSDSNPTADEPVAEPATVPAEPSVGEPVDAVAAVAKPRVVDAKRRALARARARARAKNARANRPRRELTAKEQRKVEKRRRKIARQAERKQCDALADQILKVSDDEWWFGREIANCYRTHLEQFDRLGGAWWKKDESGKSIGVGLSVSRSRRGEPARRAGFQTGDVIQSVNGLRVRSWGGVTIAATQLTRKRVKLKMIRDGEKRTITLRVVSLDTLLDKRAELEAVAEVP